MPEPPQQLQPISPEEHQQQMQMQQVFALNIASFLRDNKILKQRTGEIGGSPGTVSFFKFKRAERALLSDDYKKLSSNPKNKFPLIDTPDEAKAAFALLINAHLAAPAGKLHTVDARKRDMKPKKGTPCFELLTTAELSPKEYYIWRYKKRTIKEVALGVGIVAGIMTLILFPLWPTMMRQGVVILSQFVLGLFALLIVLAIVRLILYVFSLPVLTKGFWLFPNLFADVGFFDSFKPLYGFDEEKKKRRRKSKKTGANANGSSETGETNGTFKVNGTNGSSEAKESKEASTTSANNKSAKDKKTNGTVEQIKSQNSKTHTTSAKANKSSTTKRKGVILEEVDE